jgi:hypothetical protein
MKPFSEISADLLDRYNPRSCQSEYLVYAQTSGNLEGIKLVFTYA